MKQVATIFKESLAASLRETKISEADLASCTDSVASKLWDGSAGELLDILVFYGNAISNAAIEHPVWPYDVVCIGESDKERVSSSLSNNDLVGNTSLGQWAIALYQWEDIISDGEGVNIEQMISQWRAFVTAQYTPGEVINPHIISPLILAHKLKDILGENILSFPNLVTQEAEPGKAKNPAFESSR